MNACPVCSKDSLITKISSVGEETYCKSCRRIITSATLGFQFTAAGSEGIEECRGPEGDPRPGYKGPGKKAVCHLYTEGNEDEKRRAMEKAKNSAYSSQHKKAASKIVNSVAYFTGLNSALGLPSNTITSNPLGASVSTSDPVVPMTSVPSPAANSLIPAAPNGVQVGELNGANPLNSGTTSSKKIAELLQQIDGNSMNVTPYSDITSYMGTRTCQEHNSTTCGCNPPAETY